MAEPPAFSLAGVGFSYGTAPVLHGIGLDLAQGCFHAVLGPNGAGKSTLLDLLLGFKKPDAGELSFLGRPLASYSRADLARRMALVPQEYAVQFPFSVREVVLMGRHPHLSRFGPPSAEDLDLVERALRAMDLGSMAAKPITALSGGEKQRVILARALAQDSRVMVLDEPTANLDIRHALSALGLIRDLVRNQGRTVVAVMHDLNLAAQFCDRAVFLHQGRVHASGPTAQTLVEANIDAVFEVESRVRLDGFTGSPNITYRSGSGPQDG